MKIIKLKTKLEAVLGVLLLLAISVSAVHTITDDYVDYEIQTTVPTGATEGSIYYNGTDDTFWGFCGASWKSLNESGGGADGHLANGSIWNSNGNNWSAIGANIQTAIWDLNSTGGTVWLAGGVTHTITSTIVLESDVTLVAHGATINASTDINLLEMKSYSILEGGIFDASDIGSFTHACIFINGTSGFNGANYGYATGFSLQGTVNGWTPPPYDGYGIHLRNLASYAGNLYYFRADNFHVRNFEKGIFLESLNGSINGNWFTNFGGLNCNWFIDINASGAEAVGADGDCEDNLFLNFMYQPYTSYSNSTVRDEGDRGMFVGTVGDPGFHTNYVWNMSSKSDDAIIMSTRGGVNQAGSGGCLIRSSPRFSRMNFSELNYDSYEDIEIFHGVSASGDNKEMYLYGCDSGDVQKYAKIGMTTSGLRLITNSAKALIELYTLGPLHLNRNANSDIECFGSGDSENPLFKVGGRNAVNSATRFLQFQWGDGTDDDGIISTGSSGGNITLNPTGDVVNIEDVLVLANMTAAPTYPTDGMIAYADGTSWNPGSGQGIYAYYHVAWHFLG